MRIPLYQVDAFTSEPFKGNPAGVCLLDAPRPDAWMQAVAQEMNLSETAFLLPEGDGYRLRWFSPRIEMALCGHATLASAAILYRTGRLAPGDPARFATLSGPLSARQAGGWIELDFPANPVEPVPPPPGLLAALGVEAHYCGRSANMTYLVEVADEAAVRRARPNFSALAALDGVRAVAITGLAGAGRENDPPPAYDFVSRFFNPRAGVDEDPVTGSAHTHLAPFWAARLGRTSLTAYQASPRGGTLRLRLEGSRVYMAGQAVIVFETSIDALAP